MPLLEEATEEDCVDECDGQWLCCAEILENNGMPVELFCTTVTKFILCGRGKNHNLLLTGPTNCGKSLLLNPLKVIYHTFCNLATATFAWVGVENAECILLNDFRWSSQIIPWHDLLLMLEWVVVHLPRTKNSLFQWHLFAKRHSNLCHWERPHNFFEKWSTWPTRNGHDVLKVENLEAAPSSSARGTEGNSVLSIYLDARSWERCMDM